MVCYFSENITYFFLLTLKLKNMQVYIKYSMFIKRIIYTFHAGKTCKAPVIEQRQLESQNGLGR